MKSRSLNFVRRVVATGCITFVAAVFWAFMLGAVLRYAFGFADQSALRLIIGIVALCIGAILLPKFWKLMANH